MSVPQHPSPSIPPPASVSHLTGADRAAIAVQDPDLPAVLDLAVVDAVPGAVVSVGTAAVVASVQVEAHRVVGAGVPPRLAFVNICRGPPQKKKSKKQKKDITHMLAVANAQQGGGAGRRVLRVHSSWRYLNFNKPVPNLSAAA